MSFDSLVFIIGLIVSGLGYVTNAPFGVEGGLLFSFMALWRWMGQKEEIP